MSARGKRPSDFSAAVLKLIAHEVGNVCSNPGCGAPTSGPSGSKGTSNVGTGAHVTAASKGGPRYDEALTHEERRSATNAIWLCGRCARLIDNDTSTYTVAELHAWKNGAIKRAAHALATGVSVPIGPTPEVVAFDKQRFKESERRMKEINLRHFLDTVNPVTQPNAILMQFASDWWQYFHLEGHQFIRPALRESNQAFKRELAWLLHEIRGLYDTVKEPFKNPVLVKRTGVPEEESARRWKAIAARAESSLETYVAYRRAVREVLVM